MYSRCRLLRPFFSSTTSYSLRLAHQKLRQGPPLEHFLANNNNNNSNNNIVAPPLDSHDVEPSPYVDRTSLNVTDRRLYLETYGCQMNVSDTEVVWSILKDYGYTKTDDVTESDVVLLMTCAIRDRAEQKIWHRLNYLGHLKKKTLKKDYPMKIGVLGCMAERLKHELIEREQLVDLVCGPDAYRDLPRMLAVTESGQTSVNVLLSLEETYADVVPVRMNSNSVSAFVSIMRGCDNMCTYCIVPFTRGRERSRPIQSIVDEIHHLRDQGVREVTLLGQNVNSYRDMTEKSLYPTGTVEGFKTVYKAKKGGRPFADLLDQVSRIDPEVRIRFTSPHPKDFPDDVLYLIRDRPNICKQLHLPAQSGNSFLLEQMRRGYSREAYVRLVEHIRTIIPDVALSSDFIAGFCGESEEAHRDTLSLMELVKYHVVYCFPYSMRAKTRAFHRLKDDVPLEVKARRHQELAAAFRQDAELLNRRQVGKRQLVLIEGYSKKSRSDLQGRNDYNTKVILPDVQIADREADSERCVKPGEYVCVEITDSNSQVLKGRALYHTTLTQFSEQDQGSKKNC